MKALLVKCNEKPRKINIENNLEKLHELVGGYIECISIDKNVMLVCNDEGKVMDLPMNRYLVIDDELWDIIHGDFFLVGVNGEDFDDLDDGMAKKWSTIFKKTMVVDYVREDGI